MRLKMLPMIAAGLLLGVSSTALAQSAGQDNAPGEKMQGKGSVPDSSAASGNTPGHEMQNEGALPDKPGTSGHVRSPSTGTTGSGSSETTGSGGAQREGSGMRSVTDDKARDKEQ